MTRTMECLPLAREDLEGRGSLLLMPLDPKPDGLKLLPAAETLSNIQILKPFHLMCNHINAFKPQEPPFGTC